MNANPSPLHALRTLVDPEDSIDTLETCRSQLMERILILNDYAWESRLDMGRIDRWLENFNGSSGVDVEQERLHALYILSQFMYFGVREIRVLLRALYRDLFLVPAIQRVRRQNGDSEDVHVIRQGLLEESKRTRFLGIGNPSESGVHLLYYFRQENNLSKGCFADAASMFDLSAAGGISFKDQSVKRYIFVDDVCGSGETAITYSNNFLNRLGAANPDIIFEYHAVFATAAGISEVRSKTAFAENAHCIFEMDGTYKSLSADSRHIKSCPSPIDPVIIAKVAHFYGNLLAPGNSGGFNDDQLLLGFSHNIPDNTLPIIWRDPKNGAPTKWTSVFRRYMKV